MSDETKATHTPPSGFEYDAHGWLWERETSFEGNDCPKEQHNALVGELDTLKSQNTETLAALEAVEADRFNEELTVRTCGLVSNAIANAKGETT